MQIPAGHTLRVPKGTRAVVTQSLGGVFTLQVPNTGALIRVARTSKAPRKMEGKPKTLLTWLG